MTAPLTPEQERALARIEGLLEGSGLDAAALIERLSNLECTITDRAGAAIAEHTVAKLVAIASEALEARTVTTYGTYWRVLAHGIRLPGEWDDERVAQWAGDADAANKEKELGLAIDTTGRSFRRYVDPTGKRWIEIVAGHGAAAAHQVLRSDILILKKWVRVNALAKLAADNRKRRSQGRPDKQGHGKGAVENFVAAVRSLYTFAAEEGMVPSDHNPAGNVKKPKRERVKVRRSMTPEELYDVWITSTTTGRDPELDEILYEFHADTGARQEGAINLKLRHLIRDGYFGGRHYRNAIVLDQKNDKLTIVPVRESLIDRIEAFARSRGSETPDDPAFRYRGRRRVTGQLHPPLTSRHYDHWAGRVTEQHEWARQAEWTAYWFRHHLAEQVEALAGRDAKRILLGHEPDDVTDAYGPSDFVHVAWAISQLTGDPHLQAVPPTRMAV